MAASKNPRIRLLHIHDEIDALKIAIRGLSFDEYLENYVVKRAVERAVQIISEAAKALPHDLMVDYEGTPWTSIIAIGNVLRHNTCGLTTDVCGR